MAKRRKTKTEDTSSEPQGEALTAKYRPKTFGEVVGHEKVARAFGAALKKGTFRSYLLTGPSGVGKTTLARIGAEYVGCQPEDLLEMDAATNTGIDDMRQVTSTLHFRPVGQGNVKAIIVDEFHALSKAAVQSLLKMLEEPPEHVWWFLCTTEPTRVLKTIQTRCFRVDLKPVSFDNLGQLLDDICKKERMDIPVEVIDACVDPAEGSPRQAIANLALCFGCKTEAEADKLLALAERSAEAVQLARLLVQGGNWKQAQALLTKMKELNPESVRHVVRAYVTSVALSAKSEGSAGRALEILDAFSMPFNSSDGVSPLVLATGKALLS